MSFTSTPGRFIVLWTSFALSCGWLKAEAQSPSKPGTIHAVGVHELKLKPQKLRLTIAIIAQGADAKSAIESFIAHKARVKKELVAMKADEASIEFGSTQVSGGIGGMPTEMQPYEGRFISQVVRAAPNVNAADIPKIYHAVARVRAEWSLPTADPDALALLPQALIEQIKARDLMGEKNKAKLAAPQHEKLEEVQAAAQENSGYPSVSDQTPPLAIMFVAKVDGDSRKKAVKAAFDRAVAQAELLASATGHNIGELVTLRSSDVPSSGAGEAGYAYTPAYAAYAASSLDSFVTDEAQSTSASELKFGTRVEVEFSLLK